MSLIGLLVALLVICLVLWAAQSLLAAFAIGDPIRTVVLVILVILILAWLLQSLGVGSLGSVHLR